MLKNKRTGGANVAVAYRPEPRRRPLSPGPRQPLPRHRPPPPPTAVVAAVATFTIAAGTENFCSLGDERPGHVLLVLERICLRGSAAPSNIHRLYVGVKNVYHVRLWFST